MESAFVATAIVAVVEALRRLKVEDYFAVATIVVSALVGGLAGYFGVEGLDVPNGIVAGLAASGVVTVASRV